jgi:hypothetical protein
MNAQTNHPSNDTTDPHFLGPKAGQQAGMEEGASTNLAPTARSRTGTPLSLLAYALQLTALYRCFMEATNMANTASELRFFFESHQQLQGRLFGKRSASGRRR